MDLNEINENWQEEAPKLAAMEKNNPFLVPEGYFEEMQAQLHAQIFIHQFDKQQELFQVPDQYFDTLTDQISSRVKLEQLVGSKNEEVFSVPENYFENLEDKINAKIGITSQKQSKVRKLSSSWITYAAAACITAVLTFGIYNYRTSNTDNVENQIAQLPEEEIVNYLQLYSDAGDIPVIASNVEDVPEVSELLPEISDSEIEQYLQLNL
ncbi:MAG TPA: hypothetical protein VGB63_12685 [Pedobacter sp.]|jgi:hypothetical protein